ncbi:FGGY-family carbohydrate kinase [Pseudothermotoga sp.]|uniref:FGGY-family carbohydrate kinase n=1 Tax=Pseudothermotoga sp. TaxID=2033661 RepID=UPI0031F6E72F
MSSDLVLSIDCGTQSLRAILFDSNGNLISAHKEEYPQAYISPKPGWAEQPLEVYERSLAIACRSLREKVQKLWNEIRAVCVTTQRDTCVFLDEKGRPLRNAIVWLDQRMARYDVRLPWFYKIGFKIVGMDKAAKISAKKCKYNWVKQNEPEIWRKTHKFLLLSGWLNYLLTGKFVDSIANQIGHIPFNYKKLSWASSPLDYHRMLFPVEESKLVELVQPTSVISGVRKEASNLTGILEGTPVIAAGSDKGCETIGLGCLEPSRACVSLGTTVTVQITSDRYLEPIKFMPSYPAVIPGKYNPEVEIFRGFWMVSWFKKEFANYEIKLAEQKGVSVEEIFDELLKCTEPGCLGLMLQPYWGAALKMPEARGAILGFGDIHNKAYLYRSIIEGLAYAAREGVEKIEKVSKVPIKEVVVSGGGSRSDFVCQIFADVLNRRLYRGENYEGSGLGAAMAGFVGLGVYKTFEEAAQCMVRYSRCFEPNQKRSELYEQLYTRVYKKIYPKLKPLYVELQKITRYPER